MTTHLSARLAWHADGWNGHVCSAPRANGHCIGLRSYPGQMIAEDRDLWVRLVSAAPVYLQSELTAILVELEGSLSRSDIDLDCRCMLAMIDRYRAMLGAAGQRRWEAYVHRRWAAAYLGCGQSRKAIQPALRRLSYQPFSAEGWWVLGKSMATAVAPRPKSHDRYAQEAGV